MKLDLLDNRFIDGLVSVFDSPLYKPFLVYFFLIVTSFILPEKIIFEDESSLPIRSITVWGASFFLVGWMMGSWGKR